jgi:hypothetical protein
MVEFSAVKLYVAEIVPFKQSIKILQEIGPVANIEGDQVSTAVFVYLN